MRRTEPTEKKMDLTASRFYDLPFIRLNPYPAAMCLFIGSRGSFSLRPKIHVTTSLAYNE